MARRISSSADTLTRVLARYGVADGEIHAIRAGSVSRHWRVVSPEAVYALRRYNPRRSPAAIRYEHTTLDRLARRGWPVAAPHRGEDGATVTEAGGACYALFPFLPGRPAPYGSARYLRTKGRLLARLHHDLAEDPLPEQRDGFGRLLELDAYIRDERFSGFDQLLDAFGREHPALARAVRAERERSLQECALTDWDALPVTVVHADFHHDNILFARGRLTALLDFDLVHRDARVADIANSIALDCLEPPGYDTINPSAAQAFVTGYATDSRLSEVECSLIVPLIRAYFVWLVAFRLTEWAAGSTERALRSVERSVRRRFPGLDRDADTIATAVMLAVEEAGQSGDATLDILSSVATANVKRAPASE